MDVFEMGPCCAYIYIYVYVYLYAYSVCRGHNLFIHSSVDRYLSCFYFGAIMNNVALDLL